MLSAPTSYGLLTFHGASVTRFWEEVVLPYGVSHVHRYGTYHLLACRGRHYIPYGEDNSPCAWHEDGGRLSSKKRERRSTLRGCYP
ncbi:hypothetical protein TSOC_002969 [Tetrabaena socialis]|uniref:Uncharacterized protein n=1 Tax=Tetrabaena socialis TaxID=47790 RepID=A0A2J8ACQ9_9CHLO|nr:hypothetical protein TSOC_002969 [Tetrabaena socialis]|eukprot:PNH10305.1 hypothetical protein TSOC_002969 [Tetrabaena socialis]